MDSEALVLKAEIYDLSKEVKAYREVLNNICNRLDVSAAPVDLRALYEKLDKLLATPTTDNNKPVETKKPAK